MAHRGHLFTGITNNRLWLATDTNGWGDQAPLAVEEVGDVVHIVTRSQRYAVRATLEEVMAVYKLTTGEAPAEAPSPFAEPAT